MRKNAKSALATLSPEEQLADYAARLRRHRQGRHALHLKFSLLTRAYRQEHHLRATEAPLKTLLASHEGELFRLGSGDRVCVARAPRAAFDEAVLKIVYMLRDDANLRRAIDSGEEDSFLCGWYDIEADYACFFDFTRTHVDKPETAEAPSAGAAEHPPPIEKALSGYVKLVHKKPRAAVKPLDGEALGRFERQMASADVSGFIRRDPVVLFAGDAPPKVVMRNCWVDHAAVSQSVLPGYDVHADPWLEGRMRTLMTRRLLASSFEIAPAEVIAVMLRLGCSSVLDDNFDSFIADYGQRHRGRLVLAFEISEVMLSLPQYRAARERLRTFGLRSAIVGVDPAFFTMHDRQLLPAEFRAVDWRLVRAWRTTDDPAFERFRQAVRSADPAQFILEACDEEAVAFGRALGVRLFSGPDIPTS